MTNQGIPKEACLHDYRRVAAEIGRTPTLDDYNEHGVYSSRTIRDKFGDWGDVIDAAGLPRYGRWLRDGDLLNEVRRVSDELGREPTRDEFDENADYHHDRLRRRFGSWTQALDAAEIETTDATGFTRGHQLLENLNPEDVGLTPKGERA